MFGEKATNLVKELLHGSSDMPKYNEESVEGIIQETAALFEQNMEEVSLSSGEDISYFPGIQFRHSCIEYNKRCLLVYLYLISHRWNVGPLLIEDTKSRLDDHEIDFFYKYCKNLEKHSEDIGLDLTKIRCLEDIGEVLLPDGKSVNLKKNTQHFLPRNFCESFLKQGMFEQIID